MARGMMDTAVGLSHDTCCAMLFVVILLNLWAYALTIRHATGDAVHWPGSRWSSVLALQHVATVDLAKDME